MTDTELNAAIHLKVFGIQLVRHDRVKINGEWRVGETWMPNDHRWDAEHPMPGTYCGMMPPPYCTSIEMAFNAQDRLRIKNFRAWCEYERIAYDDYFPLHMSARERCEVMLAAIKTVEES